jgi:hypothetical protein
MKRALFLSVLAGCSSDPGDSTASGPDDAVVLVAAGYPPDDGPPDDPDAISEATTTPWNCQAFATRLSDQLATHGVTATVVDWSDCKDLACLDVSGDGGSTDIAVFTGSTHWGVLPDQIRDLVPEIGALSPAPGVVSAMASYETAGEYAVQEFLVDLVDLGMTTVDGVALDTGVGQTEADVAAALEDFAGRLVGD